MTFPALKTLPRKVGVVIATRNRAHFLPIALQSVLDQTHKPERILVVDDGSTDDTRHVVSKFPGVEYDYVDLGRGIQCCHAKRHGFDKLSYLPYLCCVDSDDYVDRDYLEKLMDTMESDCRVAVAYPKLRQFGEREGIVDRDYDDNVLARTNIAPSTSLMRSDALRHIGGWPIVDWRTHEDWAAWRRMRAHGWRLKKADTTYHWRRHAESQTFEYRGSGNPTQSKKPDHTFHWCYTVDEDDLVTIAVPFSGRHRTLPQFIDFLEAQTFPHGKMRLLFFDNSGDRSFSRKLRQWLSTCDYGAYAYFQSDLTATPNRQNADTADGDRVQYGPAVNHRCAGNWNRIAQLAQTDLIWCLEDDIIPPANCLHRLLLAMRPDVAAVAAAYKGRGQDRLVAKDWHSLEPLRPRQKELAGGVELCGAPGMGCVLVRKEVLQSVPMRSSGHDPHGHHWFDWNFWADVHRQPHLGAVKIDGDIVCQHLAEA